MPIHVVRRLLLALIAVLLAVPSVASALPRPPALTRVVVVGRGPGEAAAAVRRVGGHVTRDLPLVTGVAAELSPDAAAVLAHDPAVVSVTPDAEVEVTSPLDALSSAVDSVAAQVDPVTAKSVYREEVGATALAAQGADGGHIRVALVDTGVSETADLAGRIVNVSDPGARVGALRGEVPCVDLSGEGDCVDRYGHGTFLAGLIAGNGHKSGGRFAGVAPTADIVSVKIAGRNGASDVSKVLAAIQWVVSFRERYDIRVLNLAFGTTSRTPYWIDPLNLAVEQAWRSGVVVVVAAGNLGDAPGTVGKPADDPLVITVGAVDDRETPAVDDDRMPAFSSRGPTRDGLVKPDVVAPGARLVSVRLKDSYIEQQVGGGSFARSVYKAYRRGSGTSMAAAVTSGTVALLLQRHPSWPPDRVKFALTATARQVATGDRTLIGSGLIQAAAADLAPAGLANSDVATLAMGGGSLEGARGGVHVGACDPNLGECARCDQDGDCAPLTGETSAQGRGYRAVEYDKGNWTEDSWYFSQWSASLAQTTSYGTSWFGASWLGHNWYGGAWHGSTWYGHAGDDDEYGIPARGGAWYGAWS